MKIRGDAPYAAYVTTAAAGTVPGLAGGPIELVAVGVGVTTAGVAAAVLRLARSGAHPATPWAEHLAARMWAADEDEKVALEHALSAHLGRCQRLGHEWERRRWLRGCTCAVCGQPKSLRAPASTPPTGIASPTRAS